MVYTLQLMTAKAYFKFNLVIKLTDSDCPGHCNNLTLKLVAGCIRLSWYEVIANKQWCCHLENEYAT